MVYEEEPARFAACLRRWTEACGGRAVVAGVGVHLLAGPEALTKELVLSRAAGPGGKPAGYCLFAYGDFFPSRSRDARPGDAERRARMRAALGALQRPAEAP